MVLKIIAEFESKSVVTRFFLKASKSNCQIDSVIVMYVLYVLYYPSNRTEVYYILLYVL